MESLLTAVLLPVALGIVMLGLGLGYLLPRLVGVTRPQAIACAMEIGIHNSVLAITIALSPALLGDARMAVPAAVYGLLVYIPAALFAAYLARRGARSPAAAVA